MVRRSQSSAAGVLALLSEPDHVFKQHALDALNPLVPQFWAEISEHIALIESLHENEDLPKQARDSAALLASKVYYFLAEYDEALSFALGAGPAFEAETRAYGSEEYVETVLSKAIDRYIEVRSEEQTGKSDKVDPRLQTVIENIFARCIDEREYKQAIGIALESRRLDVIARIYSQTKDTSLLSYAMEGVLDTGFSLSYRDQVLSFLFPLFPQPVAGDSSPHVHALTRLLVTLSSPSLTVPFLTALVPKEKLLAYQFAFDLVEGGSQDFLESVRTELPEGDANTKEIYDKLRSILTGQESVKLYLEFLKRNNQVDLLILRNTKDVLEPRSSIYHTALTLQNAFMHSGTTSDIFLHENLDWLGLASNWSKFSATAGLGVIHKGYFEQGMTIVGPYLPQSGGESNIPGAAYSEGGALYALGLINAGCGGSVTSYLRDTLKAAQGEVVQHGAALGLGVAAMGSKSVDAFDDLKNTLFMDSAVAGEACGYSMGLIMLGTAAADSVREMLVYARETQHEKIIRGLAVGVAFIYYGRQEEADQTIKLLLAEKDPILRYGGVYTLALAYAGTSNNDAVRLLLHIAVSDTSDDVRRAAVTSLAFLLFKNPAQVPRIVQLLSESYNPHVRCGATLALGIACAGTGLQDAVEILEPMTKDSVDFVRQGAFIALGMILVQQSEASSPSLASTRALYHKVVSDKHEDPMARFGAALGQGFIDAGGRNVTISLQSRAGSRNTNAIVGMVMFCQFWYWYPLAHCACLSFDPTGIIGLNADLKAPKFEYVSNARPSLFAYPASTKPPKKEAVHKVATAVLSTTAKVKAREKKKAASDDSVMDTDDKPEGKKESDGDVEMKIDEEPMSPGKDAGDISPINGSISGLAEDGKPATSTKPAKKAEPSFEMLPNLSRVTPAQLAYITFPPEGRFQPVRAVSAKPAPPRGGKAALAGVKSTPAPVGLVSEKYAGGGCILIMSDLRPEEEAEFIDFEPPAPAAAPEPAPAGNAPTSVMPTGPHISLDETSPEAGPPEAFEVHTISDEDLLVKRLADYEIICAMRERTKFQASLLDRLPKLRLLATTGMRNFAIDVEHAKKRGITVSGTVSSASSTLEHIWALILATMRHIVTEDANIKAKNSQWQTLVPAGLSGKTLGLIGVGRLGSQTAKIAKAFNMRVIAWSPNLNPERAADAGVEFAATKAELLQQSDVVSLHIVLAESTRHIITASDLALMKPTAYLINTSRGPLIDENALLAVLKAKAIAGGGFDVYDQEPLPLNHPFRDLDNVTLSPHNGYASDTSYKAFWEQTVDNIAAFLDGQPKRILE
ncbi:D-isomer specific 2-hydroxyacid dehydrogenase [Mycena latifolia]|nr:D-isomer specific 2-hydroxyacid dehydrogenase [Mycena latifolia]